jgi:EAL domain-containing protein (putative c-di-GMP-specific phosphodiesterase class I)
MREDPRGVALVSGVTDLARRLGSATIVEGVEHADVLAPLRAVGCELAQGYHFAAAMPASELEAALRVTSPDASVRTWDPARPAA